MADERYPIKRSITGNRHLDAYKNAFKSALRNRWLAKEKGDMESVREHGGTLLHMKKRIAGAVEGGTKEATKITNALADEFRLSRQIEKHKRRSVGPVKP